MEAAQARDSLVVRNCSPRRNALTDSSLCCLTRLLCSLLSQPAVVAVALLEVAVEGVALAVVVAEAW